MRKRKEDLPVALDLPGATFQAADWSDMAVAHVRLSAGADASPLLEGLPGDKCPCPHWGYVLTGAFHVSYADGTEEVCRAGDVFYWPPGHTIRVEEDSSLLDFSPKNQLKQVYDHIGRKAASAK